MRIFHSEGVIIHFMCIQLFGIIIWYVHKIQIKHIIGVLEVKYVAYIQHKRPFLLYRFLRLKKSHSFLKHMGRL